MFNIKKKWNKIVDYKPKGPTYETVEQKKDIFSEVIGLDDIKWMMNRIIESDKQIHSCTDGKPGTAKTLMLKCMVKNLENTFFIDGTTASAAGIYDYLNTHRETQYILVDEIDKMAKKDYQILLGIMQDGKAVYTKSGKTFNFQLNNVKVFATCNNFEKLTAPIRSRFAEAIHMPEYDLPTFHMVVSGKLAPMPQGTIDIVVDRVWNKLKSHDIRVAIHVGNLLQMQDTLEDVEKAISVYQKLTVREE